MNNEYAGLNGFIWWTGVVEDRKDPLKLGRCRVRIIGWHSDNEPELGYEPTIASLSLGAERRFKFRLREDHDVKEEIILPSGSLVVMSGPCQQLWDHEIPKELKIKTPRINLTFRRVNVKG